MLCICSTVKTMIKQQMFIPQNYKLPMCAEYLFLEKHSKNLPAAMT